MIGFADPALLVVFYEDHMKSFRDLGTLMGFSVAEEA